MVISFDLDSVLAAFQLGWIEFNKQKYNETYTIESFYEFDYTTTMNIDTDTMFRRIFEFYDSDIFPRLQPIEHAVEVVTELAKTHTLYILTSRSREIKDLTLNWVNTYFPEKFKYILFTGQFSREGLNHSISKPDLCKEYSIELHIEDAPMHVMPIAELGTRVVVLEKPWNRNVTFNSSLVSRIKSLSELPQLVVK